ncbi:MAG: hypothetical protein KZQ94_15955 [Candidatus Thiodiazotropha sp. (ex Troendleina suluensis)]|nr:hypothetical protein [Candidatus Thiodiazotropha sp. (ex Troendleina suluensis)]
MEIELNTLIDYVNGAEDLTQTPRANAERNRDYYDGKQFSEEEISEFKRRKQPPIVINRIKPKIDHLLGMERNARTDPKAFPRNPTDQDQSSASAATDAIRFVVENNEFDQISSQCFEEYLIEGTEMVDINARRKGAEYEVIINRYKWDRIIYDPYSREKDFQDAKYLGGIIWTDEDDALTRFPDSKDIIAETYNHESADTHEDKPHWGDPKRKRVKLCLLYFMHKGTWMYAWFTRGGFLKKPTVSPYLDEDGEPECGLIAQSAYVGRDGDRYGVVSQYIDPQDEINHRRSKALHLISHRQTYGNRGAIEDARQLKQELAKPDGHVQLNSGIFGQDFGILPTDDMAAGQFSLLEEAKREIDAVGTNAAMSGKENKNMSGRALQTRQQSGLVELGPVFDGHRYWKKRVYRAIWNRIKQFWTEVRWLRVTDDERNIKWVGLNVPIEQNGLIVGKQNDTAKLDVDIIIEDAPDTVTLQHETFEMFSQAVQASQQVIPLDIWIEMMPGFTKKKELLEKLNNPEQKQAEQQQQAEAQEIAKVQAIEEIENTKADTSAKHSKALRDQVEAEAQAIENDATKLGFVRGNQ